MDKQKKAKKHLRCLILSAILSAMSIVLGQYLSIKIGSSIRIGFGSLPVVLAGALLGPWYGLLVGAVSDIIGCMVYYGLGELIPLVTLGMMAEGFLSGMLFKKKTLLTVTLTVVLSRVVGTLGLRTLGLWLRYHTPLETLLIRIPCVAIECVLTVIILSALLVGSKIVQKTMKGFLKDDDL